MMTLLNKILYIPTLCSLCLLILFFPTLTNSCTISTPLSEGANGEEVRCAQTLLETVNEVSIDDTDGIFDTQTTAAVRLFQSENNIITYGSPETTGYGLIGPRTREALYQQSILTLSQKLNDLLVLAQESNFNVLNLGKNVEDETPQAVVQDTPSQTYNKVGFYAYSPGAWDKNSTDAFDYVYVRYNLSHGDEVLQNIKTVVADGTDVIVNFQFFENKQQRSGSETPPPVQDTIERGLDMLKKLEGVPLLGITIDEENVFWNGNAEYLTQVYTALKNAYPNRTFLQWYSSSRKNNAPGKNNWPVIPADGWVIDQYVKNASDYEIFLKDLAEITDVIYSVVWAAPNWKIGSGSKVYTDASWWNDERWKNFYSKLALNKKYNVSSALYPYYLNNDGSVGYLYTGESCDTQFYNELTDQLIPHYKNSLISTTVPRNTPSWIPRNTCSVDLVSDTNTQVLGPRRVGNKTTFQVQVTNQGTHPSGPFDVSVLLDTNNDGNIDTTLVTESPTLLPGDSRNVPIVWDSLAGTYRARMVIDEKNDIAESNEANNTSAWKTFTISAI